MVVVCVDKDVPRLVRAAARNAIHRGEHRIDRLAETDHQHQLAQRNSAVFSSSYLPGLIGCRQVAFFPLIPMTRHKSFPAHRAAQEGRRRDSDLRQPQHLRQMLFKDEAELLVLFQLATSAAISSRSFSSEIRLTRSSIFAIA